MWDHALGFCAEVRDGDAVDCLDAVRMISRTRHLNSAPDHFRACTPALLRSGSLALWTSCGLCDLVSSFGVLWKLCAVHLPSLFLPCSGFSLLRSYFRYIILCSFLRHPSFPSQSSSVPQPFLSILPLLGPPCNTDHSHSSHPLPYPHPSSIKKLGSL